MLQTWNNKQQEMCSIVLIDAPITHTHTHTLSNLQTHIKPHPTCFGEADVLFPVFVVTNTSSLYDGNT